jgi:hypothetical protein
MTRTATRSLTASLTARCLGCLGGLLVIGAIGCVPPSENNAGTTPAAQQGSQNGQVCHEERPIGSNISRTVCRPQEDIDRDRADAQKFMGTPRPVPKTGD